MSRVDTSDQGLPPMQERLAWWFGVYMGVSMISLMVCSPIVFVIQPMVLGMMAVPLLYVVPESVRPFLFFGMYPVGYGLYIWLLYRALTAPTRGLFFRWIKILFLVVAVNQLLVMTMIGAVKR